jgi:hypothetical protein
MSNKHLPLPQRVHDLVDFIQPRLSTEDSNLLSRDALKMIFDSAKRTVRDQGNTAAHEAPTEELASSVLAADLTLTQRSLLKQIYIFTYGMEPVFDAPGV